MKTPKTPAQLRYDAYHAYLDGRMKRAKELNREADRLDAALLRKKAAA